LFDAGHDLYIRFDEYDSKRYIHLCEYEGGDTWQKFLIPSG
jgi:hypothetical protein